MQMRNRQHCRIENPHRYVLCIKLKVNEEKTMLPTYMAMTDQLLVLSVRAA